MANDNPDNPESGVTRIEPAAINLTATAPEASAGAGGKASSRSPLIWAGLGALLMAAVVVIFVLPSVVSKNKEEPVKTAATTPAKTAPAAKPAISKKEKVSPWEKAQEASLRKETQDILSQMLEAQKSLADHGVEAWAPEDYATAMGFAAQGDEFYNERNFLQSKEEYQKGLEIFSRLVEEMDVVFEEAMETGNQALVDGNSALAKEQFGLALAMDAIDRAALKGMERAQTLDEVLVVMSNGNNSLEKGELEKAKEIYNSALALDELYEPAKKQIELVDQLILDREFAQHMSAGFSSLEKKRYSSAQKSFNAALKLKPRSAEARSALEQSRNKLTTINISNLIARAEQQESEEQWHEALATYRAALKIDPNLASAQKGEKYSDLRSKLHDRLEQILSQPQRLYDIKVFNETKSFQSKLNALGKRGPLLTKQLGALDELLRVAETPVSITIRSDNQTRVTLRKVGELGVFSEKIISVKPGKYVLVGIRNGYRDVRVEFDVDPNKQTEAVVVQAAEKIALGR